MKKSIKIRALVHADANQIAVLANNRKIWDNLRNLMPYPYLESDATNFIKAVNDNPLNHVFAIIYGEELCGVIGLFQQQDVYEKSAEIGYWIGELYWGLGIATKAVELITQFGFGEINIVRIYTGIYEHNKASMRVLEKNGFVKEAVFRKAIYKNKKLLNEHRYSRLHPDFD